MKLSDKSVQIVGWKETNRETVPVPRGLLTDARAGACGARIAGGKSAPYGFGDLMLYSARNKRSYRGAS